MMKKLTIAAAWLAAAAVALSLFALPVRGAEESPKPRIADVNGVLNTEPAPAATPAPSPAPAEGHSPAADPAPQYDGPKELVISNDFISAHVNVMPVDTGRFLARTVKGDPARDTDDSKILIYGGALPWTSFTTIRIDGKNYVFGGSTHRRAGRDALYGQPVDLPRTSGANAIVSRYRMEDVEVTQTLSIVSGPVSKLNDTIKISYDIRNLGASPRKVGVRAVIDTFLGSNDGSPFKVGESSVTSETELTGADVPEYWIAFDSLEDPGVVARGTLRGPGLTTPDRVLFANWGKVADNLWTVHHTPGGSFQRENEDDMDSATALYWEETVVPAQGELQVATLFGIDYLDVIGDVLSIGANRHLGEWSTAKNQIRPYTLYAYVANSSNITLNDVLITIDLPTGIEFAGRDSGVRRFAKLEPGEEATIGWVIRPKPGAGGDKTITISGSAREVDSVSLKIGVTLLSPPEVATEVVAPQRVSRAVTREYGPYGPPFHVQLKCKNTGRSPLDGLKVELVLPEGLEFPRIQKAEQSYRRLDGLQEVVFSWRVSANGEKSGALPLKFNITSESAEDKTVTREVTVDPLPVAMGWTGAPAETYPGMFFTAELFVTDIEQIGEADMTVRFNADVLQAVMASQGTLFVEKGQPLPWRDPVIDNKLGLITGIKGRRTSPLDIKEGSIVKVYFRAVAPGESGIDVEDMVLKDLSGGNVEYSMEKTVVKSREE